MGNGEVARNYESINAYSYTKRAFLECKNFHPLILLLSMPRCPSLPTRMDEEKKEEVDRESTNDSRNAAERFHNAVAKRANHRKKLISRRGSVAASTNNRWRESRKRGEPLCNMRE